MRIKTSVVALALVMCTVFHVRGQHASAQTWTLPQGTTAKDNGPRTYRFIVDYNTANTRGEMLHRQRLPGADRIMWTQARWSGSIWRHYFGIARFLPGGKA
jgi:hypothetical protein